MKKILSLIVILFISTSVFARCGTFDESKCPTTICPDGTFMGDDGKCYGCDTDMSIKVRCIGYEKAFKICPNRFFEWACGLHSKLKCFDEESVERRVEEEGNDWNIYLHNGIRYSINYATHRCGKINVRY